MQRTLPAVERAGGRGKLAQLLRDGLGRGARADLLVAGRDDRLALRHLILQHADKEVDNTAANASNRSRPELCPAQGHASTALARRAPTNLSYIHAPHSVL